MFGQLKQTFQEWTEDQVPLLAAGLAYYTLFSIAPLLLIVIGIAGLVLGENAAQSALMEEVRANMGSQAADAIESMLANAGERGGGVLATVIGAATLVLGATTVLVQLQRSLNTIWEVEPSSDRNMFVQLLTVRGLSLGLILVSGLLLLASFLLSSFLGTVWQVIEMPQVIWEILDFLISLAVITLVIALIFKFIPDAQVEWRDVWTGAIFTAVLLAIGQFGVSLYIGRSGVASTYGAAGSLVVLLLWVYFAAQILLFGAEFTQVYARRRGARIQPAEYAKRTSDAHEREPETS